MMVQQAALAVLSIMSRKAQPTAIHAQWPPTWPSDKVHPEGRHEA